MATAANAADCQAELQTRTCEAGEWSAWSGSNTFDECLVQGCSPAPDWRFRYAQAEVDYPVQCVYELQLRQCENGVKGPWSGSFTFRNCVTNFKDCGATKHGTSETRTRYREAHVPFGGECEAEEQTRVCNNGTFSPWSGLSKEETCEVALPAACDGSAHGTVEERVRFEQAIVDDAFDCKGETQSRTCSNGTWSSWSGSAEFAQPRCHVAPDGYCEEHEQCLDGVCSDNYCGCPAQQQLASCGGVACCECVTHWTGPACEVCPGNFDAERECNACRNHWTGKSCQYCPPNFSADSDCTVCASGWSGPSCEEHAACVRYVDWASKASAPTGSSWAEAFKTIAGALSSIASEAQPCDVWVRKGTYEESLSPVTGTRIYGGFAGTEESLSQRDFAANEVVISKGIDGSGTVDGVTLHQLVHVTSALTVRNSRFERAGRLVANGQDHVVIEDSEFQDNSIVSLYIYGSAEVVLRRVRIAGGGKDEADGSASAVWVNDEASVTLENSLVEHNYVSSAVLHVEESGRLELLNTVVADNALTWKAADVIRVDGGTALIVSSTIARNFKSSSTWEGTHLAVRGQSETEVVNSILWSESSRPITTVSDQASLVISHSIVQGGFEGPGNLDAAPKFQFSWPDIYMLASDSPGIDAADGDLAPELDLLGAARFDVLSTPNTGIGKPDYADIGAYEFH